jgi:hypothetical protein
MTPRTRPARSLLLAVTLACALSIGALTVGAMSAAGAADLTKGTVKKIAAKVVKKQAPKLSVAHAVTADSATNAGKVGGLTAASLQTTVYRYPLPEEADSGERFYTFPGLPAGKYLVSYVYSGTRSDSSANVSCVFVPSTGVAGLAATYPTGGSTTIHGGATVTATVGPGAELGCETPNGTFHFYAGSSEISFTAIDTLIVGTPTSE